MLTQHPYKTKKGFGKSNELLSNQLHNLTDPPEFSLQVATLSKKLHKRSHLIKRTIPFLLAALLLPVVFLFFLMTNATIDKWLLSFLFTCLEINILFTGFALYNYFEGKNYREYV